MNLSTISEEGLNTTLAAFFDIQFESNLSNSSSERNNQVTLLSGDPTNDLDLLIGRPTKPSYSLGGSLDPLGSAGSDGSSGKQNIGGIEVASSENIVYGSAHQVRQPPQPLQQMPLTGGNWDMPWTGPPSGGSGSNTTYALIYDLAAPPTSASNYVTIPHGYPRGGNLQGGVSAESASAFQPQTQSNLSSSGNC